MKNAIVLSFLYIGLFYCISDAKKEDTGDSEKDKPASTTTSGATKRSFCDPSPCPGHHVCIELNGTHACVCPENFMGDRCSIRCNKRKADVAFLVDSSRSVTELNWQKVLNFLEMMTRLLSIDADIHRMGVISFADEANIDFTLKRYIGDSNAIARHVYGLPFLDGKTNISGALKLTREDFFIEKNGYRKGVDQVAIIVTDGTATVAKSTTVVEARKTVAAQITIYAVGVGDEINEKELATMVSVPASEHIFRTPDYETLGNVGVSLIGTICGMDHEYLPGFNGEIGQRGEPGGPGMKGDLGEIGTTGPRGNRGPKGIEGSIGDTGTIGRRGPSGPEGTIGQDGAAGVVGPPGVPGLKGQKGDTGYSEHGVIGIKGIPGLPGLQGIKGQPGNSSRGIKGRNGLFGQIGATGITGATGEVGQPGVKGTIGEKGLLGDPGHTGVAGPRGPDGSLFNNPCDDRSPKCQHTCVATLMGSQCECLLGYELLPDGYSCQDINECLTDNGRCEQECKNTIGSYICSCKLGYTLSKNLRHCNDINECCAETSNPMCSQSEICVNTLGSYGCLSKDVAYFPKPRKHGSAKTAESVNKTTSLLLSTEMFVGLILWSGILTLLTLITLVMMWFADDNSLRRLRDAHLIEQRYHRTREASVPKFVFPRFSTEDLTDCNPRSVVPKRQAPVPESRLYKRSPRVGSQLQKPTPYKESSIASEHRRGSATSVTIQSPGGHVTSITA